MYLVQRLSCLFGKHRRDSRRAHRDNMVMRSRCKGCGRAMVKDERGWALERKR